MVEGNIGFEDNRPEVEEQRQLQELANNSDRNKELEGYQMLANQQQIDPPITYIIKEGDGHLYYTIIISSSRL